MIDPSAIAVVVQSDLDENDPDAELDLTRWQDLAAQALAAEGVAAGELNLLFIDAAAMTDLNVEHMDGTGPTDVLAFPIDGEDLPPDTADGLPVLLGDVVICPAVARTNAVDHACSFEDELALLVVHGVLHVLGHDHAEPAETTLMRSREQALLAAHHRP